MKYIALLSLLAGCGLDKIDVHTSGRAVVAGAPFGPVINALPIPLDGLTNFSITDSQEVKNKGVKPSQIDSVKMRALSLTVERPPGGSLDFIQHIDFFAQADGLPTVNLASTDVPSGATTVQAHVEDVELKPYATAPSMTISSKIDGHRPADETTLRVDVTLRVDAALGPF